MSYVQGFLIPVPKANKAAYRDLAAKAAAIFKEYGATRVVENWADNVPDGKVTDFKRAVKAEADEAVVFSWTEWPDKATCDAAATKMESDPRWKEMGEMPFDGKRMIWAGFEQILADGK
ncbi:MAG: DUF1428 domain-containing protein [Albidovulum sp.]